MTTYDVKDSTGRMYKVNALTARGALLTVPHQTGADVNAGYVRLSAQWPDPASPWIPASQVLPNHGAACPRCGGWTKSGGMSQHANGPQGCHCNVR